MRLEDLAAALHADPRALRILCDALTGLQFLEKGEQGYRTHPEALEFLLPEAAQSQAGMLQHIAALYEKWGHLYDVVLTGQPVDPSAVDPRLRGDEKVFAQAMASSARTIAKKTVEALDLAQAGRMLDIGGGPGLYAIEFARHNPNLRVTLLDNQKTGEVARAHLEQAALASRISILAGDAFHDSLGGEYDFIFLSNVVHQYSAEQNRKLLKIATAALTPGGRICIKDFLLNDDRTTPAWSALFAINMLVNTEKGDCYTFEEVKNWLRGANLAVEKVIDLTPQSRMVIGKKDI
jgi:predicted O-methyltransferase YrrM